MKRMRETTCRKAYLLLLSLVGTVSVTHSVVSRTPWVSAFYDCEHVGPLVHGALTSADMSESVSTVAIPLSV